MSDAAHEPGIETPEEMRARLKAEDLVRNGDATQQIIGETAIRVANMERQLSAFGRRLWTEDQMREWITSQICAARAKTRCAPRGGAVGRAMGSALSLISDTRMLLLIIIILLVLLGKTMQVDVGREVGTVMGTARIHKSN